MYTAGSQRSQGATKPPSFPAAASNAVEQKSAEQSARGSQGIVAGKPSQLENKGLSLRCPDPANLLCQPYVCTHQFTLASASARTEHCISRYVYRISR